MDFNYGTEHDDFRASLRGFLRSAAPPERVRAVSAADGHNQPLWRRLCTELGLPGLHVDEPRGGAGGTLVEAAIAFEELGRALTPVPLAATVFAIEAILRMGTEEQQSRLLPRLLNGDQPAALAVSGPAGADAATATVRAVESAGACVLLSGEYAPVLHGHAAGVFVVPAATDGVVALHVVDADDPGVRVERLPSFDTTRPLSRLRLTRARAEALTAGTPDGIDRVVDTARVLLAAEMLGGAEACLEMTVDYACSRRQFGRSIGSFQAVKHACADMMIEIDATRAAVMYAAMTAADPDQLPMCAPLAKAQAADTFTQCAGSAIQLHGGIAFTWEHDLHLYFRRAKSSEALFGSSAQHRALLADRAGL